MKIINLASVNFVVFNNVVVKSFKRGASNFWTKIETLVDYFVWEPSGYWYSPAYVTQGNSVTPAYVTQGYSVTPAYVTQGYWQGYYYTVSQGYTESGSNYTSVTCSVEVPVMCYFEGGCVEGQYDAGGTWYPGACYEPQWYHCSNETNYYECGYDTPYSYWVDTSYQAYGEDWVDTSYQPANVWVDTSYQPASYWVDTSYQPADVWQDTSANISYQRLDTSYAIG